MSNFYVHDITDSHIGPTGITGTYSSYTYTRALVDYTGITHGYISYIRIFFDVLDNADHKFKVTYSVDATASDKGIPGSIFQTIDRSANRYMDTETVSPFLPTYVYEVVSGLWPDGFGGYYYRTKFELLNEISWSSPFVNPTGGTYTMYIKIESDDGGGVIIAPNSCRMIVEQN
jgi:hypothetical protein